MYCAGIVAILAFLDLARLPGHNHMWREITDFGHTPLFGVLSLIILGFFTLILGDSKTNRVYLYLAAFVTTTILGVITELLQIVGPRDADLWDIVRNIEGAASFLALYVFVDRRVVKGTGILTKFRKHISIAGIIIFILSLVPTILWGATYFKRNALYPRIIVFDSSLFFRFLDTNYARLKAVDPPKEFASAVGEKVGKLTVYPGDYCGFEMEEPFPNWFHAHILEFNVYVPKDTTFSLSIRIDDKEHNLEFTDRYTGAFMLHQGENKISIPVGEIERAPETRHADIRNIDYIFVFVYKPFESFDIYFDEFILKSHPNENMGLPESISTHP